MPDSAFLPHISYDSVIFGFSGDQLKILVIEYHNTEVFALPGGFVKMDEDLNDAVRRGLEQRTGLKDIYLEQFYTFGSLKRYQPHVLKTILEANGFDSEGDYKWLLDRFITVAYYALINYKDVVPEPDSLSDSCKWYSIDQLPPLMLDHAEIVSKAIETLRENLDRKLVGMNLLPKKIHDEGPATSLRSHSWRQAKAYNVSTEDAFIRYPHKAREEIFRSCT